MHEQVIEYVGFWRRFAANLLDTVLIMAVTVPLTFLVYGSDYFADEMNVHIPEGSDQVVVDSIPLIAGPADFIISWVFPAVAIIAFWLRWQATPGKMAVSARVVDARTGGTISLGQAIGRYFFYVLSMLPLFLGFFWIAFDPKKQGWHDKLAGTVVIRGPRNQNHLVERA